MINALKPLAKSVLIPLALTVAVSATGSSIKKKIFGSGMKTLITSNEEMDDVIKIIKSLGKFGFLIKRVSETIQNEGKKEKDIFFSMVLGTLGASLLENLLTVKRMKKEIK